MSLLPMTFYITLKDVPLTDICTTAAWTSCCTFAHFCKVNVAIHIVGTTVSSGPSLRNCTVVDK